MSTKTFIRRDCYCKSWQFRNDSTNVAAVLNPVYFEHDDTMCYCHEKKIPPRLFSNPKECVFMDDESEEPLVHFNKPFTSKAGSGAFKIPQLWKDSGKSSKVRSKSDKYLSETDDLGTDKFKSKSSRGLHSSGLDFFESEDFSRQKSERFSRTNGKSKNETDSSYFDKDGKGRSTTKGTSALSTSSSVAKKVREDEEAEEEEEEEEHRRSQKTHSFRDKSTKMTTSGGSSKSKIKKSETLFDEEENEGYKKSEETEKNRYEFQESTHTDFSDVDPKLPLSNLATVGDMSTKSDLKQLSDFRKDHFFETHSTEDLIKPIPEHICVHRFGLDDRLLPHPLHADAYGVSRCIICGKPMDTPALNKIDERTLKKKNILPKFYKYGLAPKKIYMGNDEKVKIDMKLDCKDENFVTKTQEKPNYFNTYALRYQKGVA